ncbi:hypothetical protein GUJ93_ZPchr0007g3270 [Zizania palustris]|uniref:MADS-box domain-containing protein n=1 Tax=Zizania palustris TaxID=103762 RepID=A0A8J5T776_ZIZPA|nr:hypothetical protein GUJ93_ZPchr0007g3270 [Zizania palustris]
MPRRSRRTGMRYIENDRDRSITLSKRRDGIFKIANDLSILTGASVAIILDGNNKVQLFGAPLVEPIIDTFMSEYPSMESLADEQLKTKIEQMQSEVLQLERENAEKDKRLKESICRFKEAEEESLGDQPTSEVQAYNPVEQPQNHSTDYIPNFGDNYISDFLADISEDSNAVVDPLVSPLVDDQWFDNYLFAELDPTDGNVGQVVSDYGVPQAPGVPAGGFFHTLPGSSFSGENANADAGY